MWEVETVTNPVARKDYHCQASDWIVNAGLDERDYEAEDWAVIEKAKAEGFQIKKGTKYLKVSGKFDGEFQVFRAREELEAICQKYELYDY